MALCSASGDVCFTPGSLKLSKTSSAISQSQPELLARHFTEAGLTKEAITYWGIAGRKSAARSAMLEAIGKFRRAWN